METSHSMESWLNPSMWQQKITAISWDQEQVLTWIKDHQLNLAIMTVCLLIAIRQVMKKWEDAKQAGADRESLPAPEFPPVEQLKKFLWKEEEPLKLRPFKPTYHLTMDNLDHGASTDGSDGLALQNLDPTELVLMDKNYKDRIGYRRKIIKENGHIAIGVQDDERIGPAVRELYDFIMATYLTKRYPDMFRLHFATFETGDQFMLENLVTREVIPAKSTRKSNTTTLLTNLGRHLDEDFLLLLPEEDSEDPKYQLLAYDVVCPSGWDPSEKSGKRLADIHGPVPSYQQKLESSMDKYFKTLPVGKYVKRANWSIVLSDELFIPGAETNHAHEGDVIEELDKIDPEKTYLRCERQTLHRLPKSKAIVFAFKTYLTPLMEIKQEGLGDELADAVDGMKNGSAPGIHFYKRAVSWGPAVTRYLRS